MPDSHPEEQPFPSPVPTYSVFPVESLESATRAPTELRARTPVSHVQLGFAAKASSVRQTPPPETPAHMRQLPDTQVGAITRAVTRLAVALVAPENARTPGWMAS